MAVTVQNQNNGNQRIISDIDLQNLRVLVNQGQLFGQSLQDANDVLTTINNTTLAVTDQKWTNILTIVQQANQFVQTFNGSLGNQISLVQTLQNLSGAIVNNLQDLQGKQRSIDKTLISSALKLDGLVKQLGSIRLEGDPLHLKDFDKAKRKANGLKDAFVQISKGLGIDNIVSDIEKINNLLPKSLDITKSKDNQVILTELSNLQQTIGSSFTSGRLKSSTDKGDWIRNFRSYSQLPDIVKNYLSGVKDSKGNKVVQRVKVRDKSNLLGNRGAKVDAIKVSADALTAILADLEKKIITVDQLNLTNSYLDELGKEKNVTRDVKNLVGSRENSYASQIKLLNRIGLGDVADELKDFQAEAFQEAKKVKSAGGTNQEVQDAYDKVMKTVDWSDRIKTSFKESYLHLGKWGGPLGVALLLAGALVRQLLKFDEEAVKTKRVIGQWADASALANTQFVTGTEVLKTMRDLGEQFHINPVQVFSGEELGRIAQAQKLTGMSAEAAGNLGVQSKIIGKNADTYRDSIAAGANQANRLNHSAVTLSAVQNDVLNTSRAITLSYGKNVEGLAKAAGSAAALGMNLQQVEDISKNLMNFESSIQAEMQAQLLTGMQLNLAKAREYALNNDLNGVIQEVSRQGMDAAKFSHMNYIQQENMAKALGMSREQMSKMLIMQEINRGLTAEQVAAMTGMRKEDIEALSAQEKWQTMKQRFLESLVPLLEPILQITSDILRLVSPIVGFIGKLAGWLSTHSLFGKIDEDRVGLRALHTLALGLGTIIAVNWLRGLRGAALLGTRLGRIFTGLGTKIKGIGAGIGNWALQGKRLDKVLSKNGTITDPGRLAQRRAAYQRLRGKQGIGDKLGKPANPVKTPVTTAAAKGPSKIGKVFSSLGKNIGKIAIGAAAMGIMSLALIGIAKALQMLQGVEWKQFGIMAASIGLLAGTMVALGAIMMSGVGAALLGGGMLALGMLAVGMIAVGAALDSLGKGLRSLPAGTELTSISGGIRAIAGSVGELAVKLKDLQPRKLRALGKAFKNLRGAGIQIQTPVRETGEVVSQVSKAPENTGESKEIKRETIEAAAQSIVIKQAQVQASAQQISVEQKATDLSKIEQKIDRVVTAIRQATPSDWNWLEFNRAYEANT